MEPYALNPSQLDLLFHAGIYGLCRVPANAVQDIHALHAAGLVELNEEHRFRLSRAGERHVAELGGHLTARHLH